MRMTRILAVAALAVGLGTASVSAVDLNQMSLSELEAYVEQQRAAEKAPTPASAEHNLPDPSWFKPELPNLEQDSFLGRALNVGRLFLGAFGSALMLYAMFRLAQMSWQVLQGKTSLKQLGADFAIYALGVMLVFILMGGAMYQFLQALYAFVANTI